MNDARTWDRREHVRQSKYIETEVTDKLNSLEIPLLPEDERLQVAFGSFANTIHHSRAITLLVDNGCDGSALALSRSCFEAFIRGLWLRNCAKKDDIQRVREKPFPKIDIMLAEITAARFTDGYERIKKLTWDAWNSHTHGGWEQIQWHLSAEGIKQNFPCELVALTLIWADHFHLYSAAEVAAAAGNKSLQLHFLILSIVYQKLNVFVRVGENNPARS